MGEIHKNTNTHNEINKTKKQMIRRLHLKKNNEILIGVDVFIYIWSQIPAYKFLSKLIELPIIYQFSNIFYEVLALLLYLKNYRQVARSKK